MAKLDRLPFEVTSRIYQFCPLEDGIALSQTCKGLLRVWQGLDDTIVRHKVLKRVHWFALHEGGTDLDNWGMCAMLLINRTRACLKKERGWKVHQKLDFEPPNGIRKYPNKKRESLQHTDLRLIDAIHVTEVEDELDEIYPVVGNMKLDEQLLPVPGTPRTTPEFKTTLITRSGHKLRHVSTSVLVRLLDENNHFLHVEFEGLKGARHTLVNKSRVKRDMMNTMVVTDVEWDERVRCNLLPLNGGAIFLKLLGEYYDVYGEQYFDSKSGHYEYADFHYYGTKYPPSKRKMFTGPVTPRTLGLVNQDVVKNPFADPDTSSEESMTYEVNLQFKFCTFYNGYLYVLLEGVYVVRMWVDFGYHMKRHVMSATNWNFPFLHFRHRPMSLYGLSHAHEQTFQALYRYIILQTENNISWIGDLMTGSSVREGKRVWYVERDPNMMVIPFFYADELGQPQFYYLGKNEKWKKKKGVWEKVETKEEKKERKEREKEEKKERKSEEKERRERVRGE